MITSNGSCPEEIDRTTFRYCSHFCEENIYHMASRFQQRIDNDRTSCGFSVEEITIFVVFVSSESKQTPIWHQKLGNTDEPVFWDYHVILVAKGLASSSVNQLCSIRETLEFSDSTTSHQEEDTKMSCIDTDVFINQAAVSETLASYVFDLDSDLPFPSILERYFQLSFCPEIPISVKHQQQFRVIPARTFIDNFSSDRSHMKSSGLRYPEWPCISGSLSTSSMNLHDYTSMRTKSSNCSNTSTFGQVFNRESFRQWCSDQ